MRTSFAISSDGHVFFPDERPSSKHVIFAERRAHAVRLTIKPNSSPIALMKLLRHIRDIKSTIAIQGLSAKSKKLSLNTADACLHIGQLALKNYEDNHQTFMTSDIKFWSETIGNRNILTSASTGKLQIPQPITHMAMMRLGELDTATALTHFTQAQMQQASFIYPDADQNLHIGRLPRTLMWPAEQEWLEDARLDWITEPYGMWLQLVAEITLASRRPLLHFGHFQMGRTASGQRQKTADSEDVSKIKHGREINFIRLLYPLTADREKPDNYRLISLAFRLPDEVPIL